jgi:hypothetical protein
VSKKLHAFGTPNLEKKTESIINLVSRHINALSTSTNLIYFSHSSKVNGFDSQKELTSQWFRG